MRDDDYGKAWFGVPIATVKDLPFDAAARIEGVDPEKDNTVRAAWAGEALLKFARRTGVQNEDVSLAFSDLLCNLMHLCDAIGEDWEALTERADVHYQAEIGGE